MFNIIFVCRATYHLFSHLIAHNKVQPNANKTKKNATNSTPAFFLMAVQAVNRLTDANGMPINYICCSCEQHLK